MFGKFSKTLILNKDILEIDTNCECLKCSQQIILLKFLIMILKNLKKIGKTFTKAEQKKILGGLGRLGCADLNVCNLFCNPGKCVPCGDGGYRCDHRAED